MRKKKELNPINISFLDVLAGALGAVIILFIIIPKIDIQDIEKLETLKQLEAEITSIDSVLAVVQNSVPREDYKTLLEYSSKIQASLTSLAQEVESLQSTVSSKTKEVNVLRNEIIEKNQAIASMQQQIKENKQLKAQVATMHRQIQELEQAEKQIASAAPIAPPSPNPPEPTPDPIVKDSTPDVASQTIGINPPLAIKIDWENKKDRVRLYMNKKGTNFWCYYQPKRRVAPFAKWVQLPKRFSTSPHEVIIQEQLVPGEYEIYVHADKLDSLNHVSVTGQISLNISQKPFLSIPIAATIPKGDSPIKGDKVGYLGTLIVKEDDMEWQQQAMVANEVQ